MENTEEKIGWRCESGINKDLNDRRLLRIFPHTGMTEHKHKVKILLVRHGESESNIGGRTESPSTIRLTEKGLWQSRKLLEKISVVPELIIVTSYTRTAQTAAPLIGKHPDVPVETWPLHEFTFLSPGLCNGTTPTERAPWVQAYWERCDPDYVHGEGAESFNQFTDRVGRGINKIALLGHGNVAVFTHGHVIRAAMMFAEASEVSMKHYRDVMLKQNVPNTYVHEIV